MASGSGRTSPNVALESWQYRMDQTSREMAKAVKEIVNSSQFNKEGCQAEKLKLSQAYCLLWQDCESGDVDGRQISIETNGGAAAAVLIDLVVLGKVEIEIIEPNKSLGIKYDKTLVKVIDNTPTKTYLDAAIFDKIREHHSKHPKKPEKVKDWIFHDLSHNQKRHYCSTITLDSLVELGILEMRKEKFFGRKYPTINQGLEDQLVKEVREVALDGANPSGYILALLILARYSDNLLSLRDPVLEKHFTREEYRKVKQKINDLVGIGKNAVQECKQYTVDELKAVVDCASRNTTYPNRILGKNQ